jgi:hypothetical protein
MRPTAGSIDPLEYPSPRRALLAEPAATEFQNLLARRCSGPPVPTATPRDLLGLLLSLFPVYIAQLRTSQ